MFFDESVFGRITNIRSCWSPDGIRPTVKSLKAREFVYAYGAIEPASGNKSFIVAGGCNTEWTNIFLNTVSNQFPDDYLVMVGDRASWHTTKNLIIPNNIELFFIPPATPEMNPTEQIWDELKEKHFDNHFFKTLDKVVDQLCLAINELDETTVKLITGREWILQCF